MRDKMKNETYGKSNDGAGIIYTRVLIKRLTHIKCTVAHVHSLRSKVEADDRTLKC